MACSFQGFSLCYSFFCLLVSSVSGLAAFNMCSLCLIFVNLINMCLGCFALGLPCLGLSGFLWLGMQPHRRQPTRLRHPWDSPGKNTGVGCHFLLQCMNVKSESEVTQSCPTLSDSMDCSNLPGSSVHGIFQARVLEWGAIAFSKQRV